MLKYLPKRGDILPWIQIDGGSQKGREFLVPSICDICKKELKNFAVDGKTVFGPWAWMCHSCFSDIGIGLGIGSGQLYQKMEKK